MYTRNDNPLALTSRRTIRDALLRLMKTVPYQEISVTQICREAGTARQTFYRHFEFKNDVVAFHLDELYRLYFETRGKDENVRAQLRSFFAFMLEQRDFLCVAAQNDLLLMINRTINDGAASFIDLSQSAHIRDPRAQHYVMGFIAATVCSLLTLWTERDFAETPEWMAALAYRLLGSLGASSDFANPAK